jgi:hypothetical protein
MTIAITKPKGGLIRYLFDSVSALDRIRLSASLSAAMKALVAEKNALQRVRRTREVAELLAKLAPKQASPKIKFSLSDPAGSGKALADYASNGLADIPDALRPFEIETIRPLANELSKDVGVAVAGALPAMNRPLSELHSSAFSEIVKRGVKLDIDHEAVKAKAAQVEAALKARATDDPEYQRIDAELRALNDIARERIQRMQKLRSDAPKPGADQEAIADEFERLKAEQDAYSDQFNKLAKKLREVHVSFDRERMKKANEMLIDDGSKVVSAVLASSPVSQQDADTWARKQIIDKTAAAKLKRDGYPVEDVYRDMAEFYRLTGGKASLVRLSTDRGSRANAVGVNARRGEKVINLGTGFDKTVLFHELAHFLENDPIAMAAANGFLIKRREDTKLHSLRSLTGNRGYRSGELAYKDQFMNPYIGKYYRDGATEVFSMGVQYLASPKDAAMLATKDPEMFALITGYLTSPLTPAMEAKLHMHEGAVTDMLEAKATEEELFQTTVAKLAAEVSIVQDKRWDDLKNTVDGDLLRHYTLERKGSYKYLGSHGEHLVFEGVFKNRGTKRMAKGLLVATVGSLTGSVAIHGGMDMAKAMIALADREIRGLGDVWYSYFWSDTRRKALIEAYGPEAGK